MLQTTESSSAPSAHSQETCRFGRRQLQQTAHDVERHMLPLWTTPGHTTRTAGYSRVVGGAVMGSPRHRVSPTGSPGTTVLTPFTRESVNQTASGGGRCVCSPESVRGARMIV
jgi:hypothetical protein